LAHLHEYVKLFEHHVQCTYSILSKLEYEAQQQCITILHKEFISDGAVVKIEGTREQLDAFEQAMGRLIRIV
jgi:putative IMPACT (imprinted ancient) family translation regulator